MTHLFDESVVSAVLRHMNTDHAGDNLLIVRAFGRPDAVTATMTGFDGAGGAWNVEGPDSIAAVVRVDWPTGPISERAEVRREVVALYDAACARLGVEPRPHG
ncbi:DUF2470 domain-containing protein [Microbacterium limosum]|uniref:DUF2470 domain-containing protein n=1 Tax=Microbacterium limosum TaxID=3079935 RepID=A0AAU0MH38_9MICO|nr:DUF2470 domain-containing protein [Microbacterium sp. Y20]WOQ69571.1 DUF2470 domain-containing protein [Microbacterium sp. Y20]